MDNNQFNQQIANDVKKRFYGHKKLYSKYVPQIPATAEREYVRVTNQYMKILKYELELQLPQIKEAYKAERDAVVNDKYRNDSAKDFDIIITDVFNKISNAVLSKTIGFGLRKKIENMAHLNRKLTVKEWKKAVKATLGIDIYEDYYLGDFYVDNIDDWIEYNVDLIKTIPEECLDKVRNVVYDGFRNGKTTTRMLKAILNIYGVSKRRARFIARDQTAKLNGQIQRAQQLDAGINEYVWYTVGDERVRSSHKALNGQVFSWNDAPVNSDGRKCHPGEDYGCRCIGRPVFNIDTINLPIADGVQMIIK